MNVATLIIAEVAAATHTNDLVFGITACASKASQLELGSRRSDIILFIRSLECFYFWYDRMRS